MNDRREDGYVLSGRGRRSIENAARRWDRCDAVANARRVYQAATTHEEIDAVFEAAMEAKKAHMPEWLEYDQDYQDWADECHSIASDVWSGADSAHERIDPAYFADSE